MDKCIPQSLTDKAILSVEPFLSLFYVRKLEQPRGSQVRPWIQALLTELEENCSALKAAEAWVALAFSEISGQGVVRSNRYKSDRDRDFTVFLEFYWHLYDSGEEAAIRYLNQQRKQRLRSYAYIAKHVSRVQPEGKATVAKFTSAGHLHLKANKNTSFAKVGMDPVSDEPINSLRDTQDSTDSESSISSSSSFEDERVGRAISISSTSKRALLTSSATQISPKKSLARRNADKQPSKPAGGHKPCSHTASDKNTGSTRKKRKSASTMGSELRETAINTLSGRDSHEPTGPIPKRHRMSLEGPSGLADDAGRIPIHNDSWNRKGHVYYPPSREGTAIRRMPWPTHDVGDNTSRRKPQFPTQPHFNTHRQIGSTRAIPNVFIRFDPLEGDSRSVHENGKEGGKVAHDHLVDSLQLDHCPVRRFPPVWSVSRQELCESFDWFRSYHGGVYFSGGFVKGYLLSAFASSRDVFHHDGRLIISHGGGKSECVQKMDGEEVIIEAGDQSAQDTSVNALLATHKNSRPIVLLIDDKYALFPYDLSKLGVTYAALGFFIITHAWAEYQKANDGQDQVVRYKFAFQWCESQGEPWWLPSGEQNTRRNAFPSHRAPVNNDISQLIPTVPKRPIPARSAELSIAVRRPLKPADLYRRCGLCKIQAPHIYAQGWACLNPKCNAFWKTDNNVLLPDELEYTDRFLTLSSSPAIYDTCPDLQPIVPDRLPSNDDMNRFRRFCKGWHCGVCGRLSCRYKWECLECSHCGESYKIEAVVLSAKMLNRRPKINFYQHLIAPTSGIVHSEAKRYDYENGFGEYQTYTLPFQRGYIHHIRGKNLANRAADDIFIEYQQHAVNGKLEFRRWPLRTHRTRGALLSNYFSQNSGQPYQYVGEAAHTVPMEQTSSAVRNALQLIKDRIRQALNKETDFNEVLTAAYMQRQKMAFHSDDERGLGPMVAGLSLGSPALMHFRLNPKYAKEGLEGGTVLTFLLCHGDVLVMDGAGVQEFYQHTVIPYDLRIAATARRIDP